ncbi:MAG: hypothetical protein HY078_04580 [Elusimicrobia bacterium]|nr:hypothetical protein [Elusimicrobiota bacterium]
MTIGTRAGLFAGVAVVFLAGSGWSLGVHIAEQPPTGGIEDYLKNLPPNQREQIEKILKTLTPDQLKAMEQTLRESEESLKRLKDLWDSLTPAERQQMLKDLQAMLAGIQGQIDAFLAQLPKAIRDQLKGFIDGLLPQLPNLVKSFTPPKL